ncbi:MAG TPA: hypothetical protein VKF28_01255, partial [Candidatus Dormibacteraeota bacterium]|nr:hypothetical protein [Candidatus Dormibacteraeota bacterium]
EGVLENKLQRAVTMLQNAYGEGKQVSARIRASAQSVQMTENTEENISAGRGAGRSQGANSDEGANISTDTSQLSLVEAVQ